VDPIATLVDKIVALEPKLMAHCTIFSSPSGLA